MASWIWLTMSATHSGMPLGGPLAEARSRLGLARRTALVASLSLNAVVGVVFVADHLHKRSGGGFFDRAAPAMDGDRAAYLTRQSIFEHLPPVSDDVVFLGDSQIEEYEWSETFSRAVNRGIGGDTTAGVLNRLWQIVAAHPRAIFLSIGHNDQFNLGLTAQQSLDNIHRIVAIIRRESPQTTVYLESLVPSRNPVKARSRAEISAGLKAIADGQKVRYIGFSDALSRDGLLDPAYTFDGEHLNSEGYRVWTRALSANAPELAP